MIEQKFPFSSSSAPLTIENWDTALQSGPAPERATEGHTEHQCNDHIAQLYETESERFAAAVPFVRHGLDQDERVMYVLDESSESTVRTALSDAGVDVAAALDSGAFSFHTAQDTYLQNGSFTADDMVEFYADTVVAATNEYDALRIVAETAWLRDDATTIEQFMEYEAKINTLFADEDCLALCQYDRDAFRPAIIRNIIETHPHLIYDGALCHNFYYTPPEEFLGGDSPAREVDRMLGTLRERTAAVTELQRRDRFLQNLHDVMADQSRSFEERIHVVLELGRDQFDFEIGGLNRVDPDADRFEVEYLVGDHEHFEPGAEFKLSDTYCQAAADIEAAAMVSNPAEAGLNDIPVFDEFGIQGYLGTYIPVTGDTDRTLGFLPAEGEPVTVSESDRTYLKLMGQWIGYELNRRQRERELQERKDHLSAIIETTPECIKTVAADGTLRQMNPAGLDMVEAESGSDVIGKCVYDLIAPEHRETFREFNEKICQGERGTLEFDIISLEGTRRHMKTHAAPLSRPDGTISQVALTYDITDRKEREERLEEKNNRLQSFASMLAHELRNPVTIGQIYSQQLPAETDSEAVEYVTEAFDRIEDMVDVMLVLAQGQKAIDEGAPVDLADIARDAWSGVEDDQANLNAEVDATIQADETYIRHFFQNLLENAVEHGGSDVTVTVGDIYDGFYVADDGTGIPRENRDKIFDEGYTTTAANGGTGLGLAFVERLAAVYEWDCYVTESKDGGARFEFRNLD
ncbi:MEDS domain-containing protein [Haloarcula nitratireducens]|uniref:histidine kinase n=1 Tax=Haloarcula nitratireducens TaxID=2487749 RepID=A0AAW4PHM9_9EURY|nr:MEDS domain-containing protein [Halomicroarcula nitratireducens]MBX0297540.1 MEDS domain-containing protein [Halomicroarcula nitratireducens]